MKQQPSTASRSDPYSPAQPSPDLSCVFLTTINKVLLVPMWVLRLACNLLVRYRGWGEVSPRGQLSLVQGTSGLTADTPLEPMRDVSKELQGVFLEAL